jgi:16S rRNA (cytosine1402-N4)-methyltransferase
LGGAGHAYELLARSRPGGRLLGLDRDPEAVARSRQRLAEFGDAAVCVHANFDELATAAGDGGFHEADGVLFDLGVSSFQLDDSERGFAFRADGPLDMRLDPTAGRPAADLVNRLPARDLAALIREFGEDRWAHRIAEFIVARRPLRTTGDLAAAVEAAIPRGAWPRKIHPATRTFQALRIEVNDELGSLERALPQAAGLLKPGGRLAVISFHSLEDRIAKRFIRSAPDLRPVNKTPIPPSAAEAGRNPRARSARLRVAEKL